MSTDNILFLKNCRISFPHLFTRPVINGNEGKYGATLLIDNDQDINAIKENIEQLRITELKGAKLAPEKLCLRNGEDKRDEYQGYMALSANSNSQPNVINNAGNGVIDNEEDCAIYSGCLVNAKVRLWAQNNQFGKRINCELVAIQFAGDGEKLSGRTVSQADLLNGFGVTEVANDSDSDFFTKSA